MSFKDIVNGEKVAKAKAARFIKSKGGTPGVEVKFDFVEPSTKNVESLNWVGWLSEGAFERTIETLTHVLGSNGSETTDDQGIFTDPGFLDYNREVKLVVEHKPYEGKSYPRVKWVNALGGSAYGTCEPEIVKSELNSLGLKASILAAKAAGGAKPKSAAVAPLADTEVPF